MAPLLGVTGLVFPFSTPTIEAKKIPCSQVAASVIKGNVFFLFPPKIKAAIGTPFGFSHSGSITGHCDARSE